MSSTTVAAPTNLHDVREQIFANAAVLFRRIVEDHPSFRETLVIRPGEIFDVIISRSPHGGSGWFVGKYQAVLVYGSPMRRKVAAKGKKRGDAVGALYGLLGVLADAIGHNFRASSMERPISYGNHSVVDLGLVN